MTTEVYEVWVSVTLDATSPEAAAEMAQDIFAINGESITVCVVKKEGLQGDGVTIHL